MTITVELTDQEVKVLEQELGVMIRRCIGKRANPPYYGNIHNEQYWFDGESAGRKLRAAINPAESPSKKIPKNFKKS